MLKIALITIYLLFSSSIVKSDSKINITVKESTDFTGKEFKRSEQGCGLQKNQKGNRDEESVLNIFYSKKLPTATPYNWTGLYRHKKNRASD